MKYLKYIAWTLIIVIPCIIFVLIYNDKITQNSPTYYKQGVDFYNKGDYQNAYYNFGKINKISPLYATALYKQAKSAQKVGDYGTAAKKYKLFLEKYPNSVFAQTAQKNLAKSYFYLKEYSEAKIQFEDLKNKSINNSNEEDYYLGLIEKNENKEQSAYYFSSYLNKSLKNKTDNTVQALAAAEELSTLGLELNNSDKLTIGLIYYKNQKYQKALEYFSKLPVSECWDYLVLSNHYAGNKVIAKKLIETGINTYSNIIDENNLNEIYDIYTSYMPGSKLKNWTKTHKMIKDFGLKGEDYVLYKLAEILPEEKALVFYNDIVEKYPNGNYAPESLWKLFWNKYTNKDYEEAQILALKHIKMYKQAKSSTKILFWLAKTAMKENKLSEAHSYLSKLASKYPDDYYGLRAEAILNKKNDFWQTNKLNKLPEQKEEIEFPISLSDIEIKDLKLINTLFEMGDYEIWLDADFKNQIVESWFELRKDKKSRSIVLARDAVNNMEIKPPYISAAYKLSYPLYWINEINIAGAKLNLDPYLIISLIREESYFNEFARSKSNAVGLMQLMPATANYMISKLSVNIPSDSYIENPRTNLYLGCNYLKYLYDRFDDDLMVVAAYNGGEGSVNKWIKLYGISDKDEFIEKIPFPETQNYVKKVFRTYHLYKKIYK